MYKRNATLLGSQGNQKSNYLGKRKVGVKSEIYLAPLKVTGESKCVLTGRALELSSSRVNKDQRSVCSINIGWLMSGVLGGVPVAHPPPRAPSTPG